LYEELKYMSIYLISSPMQGFTDFRFRNAFNKYFGGIDVFYAPYFRLTGNMEIKSSYQNDLLPENNAGLVLVPQILTNNANEFLYAARYVQKLGYKELNWNLGCPYPMVAKRGLGSGLINDPEKINKILQKVYGESDIMVSVKMRLGYKNKEEIFSVLQVLDKYPIKSLAIHPRIGKQLYKGEPDLNAFQKCIGNTNHTIYYNGDITSVTRFNELAERFPTIDHWMIGRGLIADPFLPAMIRNNTYAYPENRIELFSKFHEMLYNEYRQALSGPAHIIMKMLHYWEYFIHLFPHSPKGLKKIKKARTLGDYEAAVREILKKEYT
jgi:tRNA-dihydrouridine synthase